MKDNECTAATGRVLQKIKAVYIISDYLRVYETVKFGDFFFFKLSYFLFHFRHISEEPIGVISAERLPA